MHKTIAAPLALIFLLASVNTARADQPRPWGAEIDLVQPFIPEVHIIKPKVTWTAWGDPGHLRGDLVLLLYARPHIRHDIVETIDEYMVGAGYRQYVWRGLHIESLIEAGVAWGTNRFDVRHYTTAALFGEVNVGYRLGVGESLYVAPQFGAIASLGVADIGPRDGKPDWFLQGNLLVGAAF